MIDFKKLKNEIVTNTIKTFDHYNKNNEDIIGYALYSDDSAVTICDIALTSAHLKTFEEEDQEAYLFIPEEWDVQEELSFLDKANEIINVENRYDPNIDGSFEELKMNIFNTCVEALKELVDSGYFGNLEERNNKFIIFSVTDSEEIMTNGLKWSAQLNTESMHKRFNNFIDVCLSY